jgi:hypothetical protein
LNAAISKGYSLYRAVAPAANRAIQAIRAAFGMASKVPVGTIDTTVAPPAPITYIKSRESVATVEGIAVKGQNAKCGNSNKNKGDCAEALVNSACERAGFKKLDTKPMTNKSGHGIDNIAFNETEVVVIETKANTSQLSKLQKIGGKNYLNHQLGKMMEGYKRGTGRWASYKGDDALKDTIDKLEDLIKNKKSQFKVCKVKLDDDPSGCYGKDGNGKCEGEVECEIDW